MANHVNSYICIRQISEEGQKVWNDIVSRIQESEPLYGEYHLGHLWVDDIDEIDRSWMCEKVGAKWAYGSDMDEGGMRIQSAWSACMEFVEEVVRRIAEVDDSILIEYTYEDEMPNFIGAAVFNNEGQLDGEELDDGEIIETLKDKDEELAGLWDEDEGWWTDDGELYHELLWDFISDWQAEVISSTLA